jgi:large subunit ribosomal protein L24
MAEKRKPAEYPVKLRIRKGDTVMVISGKDGPQKDQPGKTGKVLRAFPQINKVLVEGVNIIIKHQKARQTGRPGRGGVRQMQEGGRISKPAPIHASKVMLVCPNCNKPTRVGYAFREGEEKLSARKYRVCKRRDCGKPID